MKILIVDDSATIRNILKEALEEAGHTVEQAADGSIGVEYFVSKKPDLILMDVEMPIMNGYQAAQKIRSIEKTEKKDQEVEDWTPIVFLSSLNDEKSLAAGIESGGDDYLFKPFSKLILNSKLKAMERIYSMRQSIVAQKKIVEQMNQELLNEQVVAKNIYDNIIQYGTIKQHDFIKTYVSSKNVFNGDLFLVARSPSENYYIIMGDFTGHGLSAALGIIPTAEMFLKLTVRGFTLQQLLIELNSKLHNILPSNIFCAAMVVEVDLINGSLAVWNGWSPDAFCISKDGKLKQIVSEHMPLGALSPEKFKYQPQYMDFNKGDRLYLYSDGFPEGRDISGQMFGVDRIKTIIENGNKENYAIFDEIIKQTLEFRGDAPQLDDLTLVEITMI